MGAARGCSTRSISTASIPAPWPHLSFNEASTHGVDLLRTSPSIEEGRGPNVAQQRLGRPAERASRPQPDK